jgi:hypothetical protein
MNAFLTPVSIATTCNIGDHYMFPLSMKLLSFNGTVDQGNARLNWQVYQNETVRSFEIQSSLDAVHFVSSGHVNGTQETGTANYTYQEGIPTGIIYFRLKITGQDNTDRFSKLVALDNRAATKKGIILVNNPLVEDRLNFIFESSRNEKTDLRVIDLFGRTVLNKQLDLRAGKNNYAVLLPSALMDGIYIAELHTGSGTFTQKFIK